MSRIGGGGEDARRPADDGNRQGESHYLGTLPGISFPELLDDLQIPDGVSIAVCHRTVGGRFIAEVVDRDAAPAAVTAVPARADVWFGPNPIYRAGTHRAGRGRESEVTRWSAFNFDLDVKPGAFESLAQAEAFVDDFGARTGFIPAAVIFSGHGLQPIYAVGEPLDDMDLWARACRASRQVGRLAMQSACDLYGAVIDTVSDMSRVVRAPGTTNWKDPDNPMPTFAVRHAGRPADLLDIEGMLGDLGIFDVGSDEPAFEAILSDCEEWDFGDRDCEYVITMVCSWDQESDRPRAGRHQWALGKAVRLAAAHRFGCLTEDGLLAALEHLHRSLEHWCSTVGDPRPLHHDEIGSVYRWAVGEVATFDDDQTRRRLGDHRHGGAWPRW